MIKLIKPSLILLFLLLVNLGAEIKMQPYLQALSPTNVFVMVESDSKNEVRVLYGPDENMSMYHSTNFYLETTAIPVTYVHRIELDNLEPGKKYFYKVIQDGVDYEKQSFKTPKTEGKIRFAVTGDNRSNPKKFSEVLTELDKVKPDYLILTGDLIYKPEYKYWKDEFFVPKLLNVAGKYGFFNAVGNHEGWKTDTKAFTQAPQSPSGKQEYYSLETGDALVLVLSTEHSMKQGSEQFKFIENELKNTNKKWKIAVFHKSAYVSGGHDDYKPAKILSETLLKKYGVDLVISGHSHFYQRNLVDGIKHVTVAGGGAPLYTPKDGKFTQKSVKQYHFAYFDIDKNKLTFKVINTEGKEIDSFELFKKNKEK